METLSIQETEYIAFRLAREMLSFNEPIPDFASRFPHSLESCLATPFQTFGRKSLYPTLIAKAGILFYLLVKNHPFQNGNKRIAMTALLVFLYKNRRWLKADTQELYNFAVWIAQSPAGVKTATVSAAEKFIKDHLVPLPPGE